MVANARYSSIAASLISYVSAVKDDFVWIVFSARANDAISLTGASLDAI
jgi:hypothetical protein